ncbi:MAG: hypothetical protein NVS2B11_13250 [Acetobacteraceae bacterium]
MPRRAVAAVILALATAPPAARAQMPVTDLGSIAARAAEAGRSLAQLQQQLTQLQATYRQVVGVYSSLAHATDANGIATALQAPIVRNALPGSSELAGLLQGGQAAGNLAGLATGYLQANRAQGYEAQGSDPGALAINGAAAALANLQAIAAQGLQSLEQRAAALPALQAEIDRQPDVQGMAAIQARIAAEASFAQLQGVQAAHLQTLASAQRQVAEQAAEQRQRQGREALFNETHALAADGTAAPNTAPDPAATDGRVQVAAAGAGGATVVADYQRFVGQKVGTGECVSLAQAANPGIGLTRTWVQGAPVEGNTGLAPGTVIATFDGQGKYANAVDGSSHTALYLGQNADGLIVEDQWKGRSAHVHTLPWHGAASPASTGSAFYVVSHASS